MSTRDVVLEKIRSWIEDGVLQPGELIRDADIAERLDVSRTPVREALQVLAQQGMVHSVPGRYTKIADLNLDDALLVYPPLAALQSLAARDAVGRATLEDVQQMRSRNERLLTAVRRGDAKAARDADTEFHGILLKRAENPYLTSAVEHLIIHIRRLETLYFKDVGPALESYDQHKQIIAAVERGDSDSAGELTRANFLRFWSPNG